MNKEHLCGHCSHNADCSLAKDNVTECDMYLPGVNSEAVYSGHLYHLDKPELDGNVRCSSCKLKEEGVCDLADTVPPGYGCIYHQKTRHYEVEDILNGYQDMFRRGLDDLSQELRKQGLAVDDIDVDMMEHESPYGNGRVVDVQIFRVRISAKSAGRKS